MWAWVLFFVSIGGIVTTSVLVTSKSNKKSLIAVLLLLFLMFFYVSASPLVRGYYLHGAGDPIAHYRWIGEVIETGTLDNDRYPIIHYLGSIIAIITGFGANTAAQLVPLASGLVFFIFTYIFSKELIDWRYGLWSTLFTILFIFSYYHISIYPQSFGVFLFPLIFYLLFKLDWRYILLSVVCSIPVVLSHQVIGVVLVTYLIGLLVLAYSFDYGERRPYLSLGVISMTVFWIWNTDRGIFVRSISRAYAQFFHDFDVERSGEVEPAVDRTLIEFIEYVIKMFGSQMILISIAGVSCLWFFLQLVKTKRHQHTAEYVLAIWFAGSGLIVYIAAMVGTDLITFGRFLNLNVGYWILPFLCSLYIVPLINNIEWSTPLKQKPDRNQVVAVGLVILLLGGFVLGAGSLYRSPWVDQPNWQHTYEEVNANDWQNAHLNESPTSVASVYTPGTTSYELDEDSVQTTLLINHQRQNIVNSSIEEAAFMGGWGMESAHLNIDLNKTNTVYSSGATKIYY